MAPNSSITIPPSNLPITLPIVTGHFLMDSTKDQLPATAVTSWWYNLNFKAVDVLNVAAFVVDTTNQKGDFVLEDQAHDGQSAERLAWVINRARSMNPKIKIMAMQWYGKNAILNLTTSDQISNYVDTVAKVIEEWTLDGYDIDYEYNSAKDEPPQGNVIPAAPHILFLIRQKLDALSSTLGRPLYVTMSPATTDHLAQPTITDKHDKQQIANCVHFVNVQTYDGGWPEYRRNTLNNWLRLGFKSHQLLYGMMPEVTNSYKHSPTFDEALTAYGNRHLAGINVWRLTGNQAFSNAVQQAVYKAIHPNTDLQPLVSQHDLAAMWNGQGQSQVPFPKLACIYVKKYY